MKKSNQIKSNQRTPGFWVPSISSYTIWAGSAVPYSNSYAESSTKNSSGRSRPSSDVRLVLTDSSVQELASSLNLIDGLAILSFTNLDLTERNSCRRAGLSPIAFIKASSVLNSARKPPWSSTFVSPLFNGMLMLDKKVKIGKISYTMQIYMKKSVKMFESLQCIAYTCQRLVDLFYPCPRVERAPKLPKECQPKEMVMGLCSTACTNGIEAPCNDQVARHCLVSAAAHHLLKPYEISCDVSQMVHLNKQTWPSQYVTVPRVNTTH